jgi:hypothetical protein
VLRTRSPRAHFLYCYRKLRVRLACVKHAASVRSEPGSNSHLKLVVSRIGFSEEKFDSRERTFTSLGSTQNPITKFVEVNLHEIRFGQTKRVLACFIQIVKELELPGLQEGVQTNSNYIDAVA